MGVCVCVLGSGSSGNATYVGTPEHGILIDAGLSGKETERRLAEIGTDLRSLKAVCVSHEHKDHVAGLGVLHRRYGLDLYANAGTISAIERDPRLRGLRWRVFTTGQSFFVGEIEVRPFSVPHDAYEPVGFVIAHEEVRVGIVTDMGISTSMVREHLRGCRVVVLESNHDEEMLAQSERPWSLKQRIMGRQGHLSNRLAAEMLAEIAGPSLEQVFLAHISAECNRGELAVAAVSAELGRAGHTHVEVCETFPDRVSRVWCSP